MKKILSILIVMLILCGCGTAVKEGPLEISKQPVTTKLPAYTPVSESTPVPSASPTPTPTPVPTPTPMPEPESVSIVMVGDILLHTPVEKASLQEDGSYSFEVIFENLQD